MKKIIKTNEAPCSNRNIFSSCKKGKYYFFIRSDTLKSRKSMELVEGIENQIHQVFKNILAVIKAADASLDDVVKLNIYLTDLSNFCFGEFYYGGIF